MTTIVYRRRGTRYVLRAEGHAEYARDGEPDIVCAAVSAMCCTLAGCLEAAGIRMEVCRLDAGDVRIEANAEAGQEEDVRAYFHMALVGLEMLAREYRLHVEVRRNG